MELDLQGLFEIQDYMHRWITSGSGLLDDYLGVSALDELLEAGEESRDSPTLGCDEEIRLITRHDVVVYREGQEEQMRICGTTVGVGDLLALEDPTRLVPLDGLAICIRGIAAPRCRTGGMFSGHEVGVEVVELRIDMLDEIREKRVGVNPSGEHIRLQPGEIRPVEHRHGTHPPTCSTGRQSVSTELALKLEINRIYATTRQSLCHGNKG